MNCDEYRQAITETPSFDGGGEHLSACAECCGYRAEIQALDLKIADALAIRVPDLEIPELPDVNMANVVVMRERRVSMSQWLAVAATIVVAAVIGIRMIGSDVTYDSLGDEILAHVEHEPFALRVTDKVVANSRLDRVVPAEIASMDESIGLITYAQSCSINGNSVPHLVIQGERGPITILLMPEEYVPNAQRFGGESVNGIILPVGSGSIAIIGEKNEPIEKIQESVVNSVVWST